MSPLRHADVGQKIGHAIGLPVALGVGAGLVFEKHVGAVGDLRGTRGDHFSQAGKGSLQSLQEKARIPIRGISHCVLTG